MNYLAYLHRKQMEALDGRVYDPPDPNIYGDPPRSWHYPKKEDTMPPTPDPPPAAPLTATREKRRVVTINGHEVRIESDDNAAIIEAHHRLSWSPSARLARAEARITALEGALDDVAAQTERRSLHTFPSKPSQAHSFTRGMRHAIDEVRRLAAPTDGAARAGDAAEGEGEA